VRHDDLEMATLLIQAGANVKATTRYGVTPLALAATNGNAALIEKLLKAGADANVNAKEGLRQQTASGTATESSIFDSPASALIHAVRRLQQLRGQLR
jgi:ankyrin repeat protein